MQAGKPDQGGVELTSFAEKDGPGSDRSFGYVFAAVFVIVGTLPALHHRPLRYWAFGAAACFLAAAIMVPGWLRPLNRLWFMFGLALGKVVTPLMMGLIFFVAITPIAALRRSLNSSGLATRFDRDAVSYWILRDKSPRSFKQQF